MTTITANLVKELRDLTGAGMMECKKALSEVGGNIEAAIEHLRKTGMAKAAKKSDRTAAEGRIEIKIAHDHKAAAIVEVNCETDFVAKDENLVTFAQTVAERALVSQVKDIATLLNAPYSSNDPKTVEQVRQELVSKLGENIQVRRIALMQTAEGMIGSYKHGDRIGVLVQLNVNNPTLAKDLAMHVAATNPQALSPQDVPADLINKEREIFAAQTDTQGKPQAIVDKMIEGRIKKFVNENSLLGQAFVKNPSETVADLLKAANAKVLGFVRFEVGEGIEKKTVDFAEEVMAQVRGSD